jgi:hypothetical protein
LLAAVAVALEILGLVVAVAELAVIMNRRELRLA